jgi:hypothetical protein
MKDLGHDPKGKTYALLSSLYYVSYAPFSQYYWKPHPKRPNLTLRSGTFRSTWQTYAYGFGPHVLRVAVGNFGNMLRCCTELLGRLCMQNLDWLWRYVIRCFRVTSLTDRQRPGSPH